MWVCHLFEMLWVLAQQLGIRRHRRRRRGSTQRVVKHLVHRREGVSVDC
jgi:hypothetical protein